MIFKTNELRHLFVGKVLFTIIVFTFAYFAAWFDNVFASAACIIGAIWFSFPISHIQIRESEERKRIKGIRITEDKLRSLRG